MFRISGTVVNFWAARLAFEKGRIRTPRTEQSYADAATPAIRRTV